MTIDLLTDPPRFGSFRTNVGFIKHGDVMELKPNEFRLSHLPPDCEPTILGNPKGADRQFRGSRGLHVRQYGGEFIGHYDKIDPRYDLAGHLLVEAPFETALVVGFGSAMAVKAVGGSRAGLIGLFAGLGILALSKFVSPRN